MGKFHKIQLKNEMNIDIDLSSFNNYIATTENENITDEEDYLLITLPEGRWCRVNPGIAFEIISFNLESDFPGYINPIGGGRCDIYSETDETQLKITRHFNKEQSYGFRRVAKKVVTYGPFYLEDLKSRAITKICYFNYQSNFTNNDIDFIGSKPPCHELSIFFVIENQGNKINACLKVLDERADAYKNFINRTFWKIVYGNEFLLKPKDSNLSFFSTFISKNENIPISTFLPADAKLSEFTMLMRINKYLEGSLIKLSNGDYITIVNNHPQNNILFCNIGTKALSNMVILIPKEPRGNLLILDLPAERCDEKGLNINPRVYDSREINENLLFSRHIPVYDNNASVIQSRNRNTYG